MRNYNIIVRKGIDYKTIVNDLINDYGSETIPNRSVEIFNEWPNLDRLITVVLDEDEVVKLRQDDRIEHIEVPPEEDENIIIGFDAVQIGDFRRINSSTGSNLNWGMIRANNTTNIYGSGTSTSQNYEYVLDGEGVDVVIMDSGITPNHPEFLDENGVSRVQLIDWGEFDEGYRKQKDYFYTDENGHGTHVAATVAGKTFGWAKKAKIFSMRIQLGHPDGYSPTEGFNLIKAWHNAKPIDPMTGVKRPTIVNMSWGTGSLYPVSIKSGLTLTAEVTYRGSNITESWSNNTPSSTILATGIWPRKSEFGNGTNVRVETYDILTDELIDAGIHVCIAAGNRGFKIDIPSGIDYNNQVTYRLTGSSTDGTVVNANSTLGPYYYHRGSSPYSSRAFMVGAIDYLTSSGRDRLDGYTNRGPGVDLYSPGSGIKSAWSPETIERDSSSREIKSRSVSGSPYYLNSSFYQRSIQGTSMATPQVTGVGALYLSANPYLTPAQLKSMIIGDAAVGTLVDSGLDNDYNNIEGSLTGGANRTLFNRYSTSVHNTAVGGIGDMTVPYLPEVNKNITLSTSSISFSETITSSLNNNFTSNLITLSGRPGTKITTISGGGLDFSFPNITEIPSTGVVSFRVNFTPKLGPLDSTLRISFVGPTNTAILDVRGIVTNKLSYWQPRAVNPGVNPKPNDPVDETENFYIALYADGVPEPEIGSVLNYSITGIDNNDLSFFSMNLVSMTKPYPLTGSITYDPAVWGRNNLYIFLKVNDDNLTEGTETLTFTVNGVSTSIDILDTSTGDNPVYTLRTVPSNTTQLNEGDSVSIFVDYSNVPLSDTISWTVDSNKLSAADLSVGSLTGSITLTSDASGPGISGSVELANFTFSEDNTLEGNEELAFSTNKGNTLSITVVDTSVEIDYGFELTVNPTGPVNEGSTIEFILTAVDGIAGTNIPYTITGIDLLDLSEGSLTGNFELVSAINNPGYSLIATLSLTISEDATSELPETLTLVLDDYPEITASIAITDTSKFPVSYELFSASASYDEGDTFSIDLQTTSVPIGSTIPYTITGISQSDLTSGSLNGSFTIVEDPSEEGRGLGSKTFTLSNDLAAEGPEILTLTITTLEGATQSISLTINDTSSALQYRVTLTGTSNFREINSSVIVWVYASAESASLPWEVVGDVTDDDFVIESIYRGTSGFITFSPRLSSDTKEPDMPYYAAVFFKFKEDYLTEGSETFQFTVPSVGLESDVYLVADLSLTPTVSLESAYDNRNEGLEYLAILTATGAPLGYTITGKINVNPSDLDLIEVSGQSVSLVNKINPIPITFTVGNHGTLQGLGSNQTYIRLKLKADSITEGPETASIILDNFTASLSFTINDTSKGVVTYTLTSPDTVAENSVTTINISVSGINDTVSTIPFKIDTSSTISVNDIQKITDAGLSNITPAGFTLGKQINVPVSRTSSTDPYTSRIYIYMKPNLTKNTTRTMVFSSFDGVASKTINVTDVNPIINVAQNKLSVNEGETVEFNIDIDNFGEDLVGNPLTQDFYIKFTQSGVDNTDFGGTTNQGEFIFTATSSQTSTFTLIAKDDVTTEGDEVIDFEIGVLGGDVWYTGGQITIVDTSVSPTPITYSLTRSIVSQPESSTATQTITLTTTGLASNTLVPFSLSGTGVTTSDFDRMYINGLQVSVNLNHSFLTRADGTSTFEVYAAADQTTEGNETISLALTNGQASVSWVYADDSQDPASYSLSANKSIVNEGDTITFTLTYTNHPGGNVIAYLGGTGVDGNDRSDVSVTAVSFINLTAGGGPYTKTRTITIAADLTTEGDEQAKLYIPNTNPEVKVDFTIVDTSTTPSETYSLRTDKSSYNEGEVVGFEISVTNPARSDYVFRMERRNAPGSSAGYEFNSGNNLFQFSNFQIGAGGPYTAVNRTVSIKEDLTTEGNQIIDVYDVDTNELAASFTILDTSVTPEPTYSITSNQSQVNEGEQISFSLFTTNVEQGTRVTASLVPAVRFNPSRITFTVGADGSATGSTLAVNNDVNNDTFSATITVDADAEANYSFTIINKTVVPESYSLAASKTSLGEGQNSGQDYITVIYVLAEGVPTGTSIPYTISGASLSDFTPTQVLNNVTVPMSLTGSFVLGSVTSALPNYSSFTLQTVADALTEGNETVTVTLNNGQASVSVVINDTSRAALSATGGSVSTDGTYNYHTFTSGGTFTVTSIGDSSFGNKVDILTVGGGGGGGKGILSSNSVDPNTNSYSLYNGKGAAGGGGGSGQVVTNQNLTVTAGQSFTVTVGAGGSYAGNGTESSWNNGVVTVTAGGGGGGDFANGKAAPAPGSGGGGGAGVLSGSTGIFSYPGGAGNPVGANSSWSRNPDGTTNVFGGKGGGSEVSTTIYPTQSYVAGGGGSGGSNSSVRVSSTPKSKAGAGGDGGNNPLYVTGPANMDPTKSYVQQSQFGSPGLVVFRYRIQ